MRRLLLSLICPAVAFAQARPDSSSRLAPLVITATRVAVPVAAPASVTVLSGDSLRARGITHLADALRLVPGATIVASSSFGSQASLFLRGGQANFVRVLLDGVPLNEPGGAMDLGALTLDNIDRVEVVRGPASVLYGADAVTGVIQLVSRVAAPSRPAGTLSFDAGSYGQRDVALAGAAATAHVALNATLSERSAEGTLPFNNGYHNRAAGASARFADRHTEAALSARWQAATYHYPTESDGTIGDRNAENTSHRLTLAFSGRRVLSERVSATWALAAGAHNPRSNDGPDTAGDTLGYYGFFSRGTITRRSASAQLTARAGATQFITVGADMARDHERSSTRSLSEYGEERGTFAASRRDRALYVQALGTVQSRGSYQVGLRLDDNSAFGMFRTVRLATSWQLAPGWRVRAAVGSAFRAPSFFENFATGYVRGNAALVPERSLSREAGVEATLRGVSMRIAAFQQRFHDLIQYTAAAATPTAPNYLNVAAAHADGIEADGETTLPASVRTHLTYAYTRTRVTNAGFDTGLGATFVLGQPLMRRPAHTARFELARRVGVRADVIAGAAYSSRSDDRNFAAWPAVPVVLPARTLVDVAATMRLSRPGTPVPVHARFRADNLTNVRYQAIYGFQAPGRSVRVGLTLGAP